MCRCNCSQHRGIQSLVVEENIALTDECPVKAEIPRRRHRARSEAPPMTRRITVNQDKEGKTTRVETTYHVAHPTKLPPRRNRTLSFGTVLPTKAFKSELVRPYKDSRDFQPNTLAWFKSASSSWFDVPYRPNSGVTGRSSWRRASTRITTTLWIMCLYLYIDVDTYLINWITYCLFSLIFLLLFK